jgi:DNA (cytosine-5)-methyltransferase 1
VILLQKHFQGDWVVENVEPYYTPLLEPQKAGRHTFWSNFSIPDGDFKQVGDSPKLSELEEKYNVSLEDYSMGYDKKVEMLKNMVDPDLGLYVLKSRNSKQMTIKEVGLT